MTEFVVIRNEVVHRWKSRAYTVKAKIHVLKEFPEIICRNIAESVAIFIKGRPVPPEDQQTEWERMFPARWDTRASFLREKRKGAIEFFLEYTHLILSVHRTEFKTTFEKMMIFSRTEIRQDSVSWTITLLAFLALVAERELQCLPNVCVISNEIFVNKVDYLVCAMSYSAIEGTLHLFEGQMEDTESPLNQSFLLLANHVSRVTSKTEGARLFALYDRRFLGSGDRWFSFIKVEMERATRAMKNPNGTQDLYISFFRSLLEPMTHIEITYEHIKQLSLARLLTLIKTKWVVERNQLRYIQHNEASSLMQHPACGFLASYLLQNNIVARSLQEIPEEEHATCLAIMEASTWRRGQRLSSFKHLVERELCWAKTNSTVKNQRLRS